MYSLTVDDSPTITVANDKHMIRYAVNGALMNPLEAFYASLAGCAGVYAKKACKELGVSAEGIAIYCKPFAGPSGPLSLANFKTEVSFPDHFSAELRARVLHAIGQCAVKKIFESGGQVGFSVGEARLAA